MALFNINSITNKLNAAEDMAQIKSYLKLLNDNLNYCFNNLTFEDNLSESQQMQLSKTDEAIAELALNNGKIIASVQDLEGKYESRLDVALGEISMKVSSDDLVDVINSQLTITGKSIDLTTGHFTIDSANLQLDESGNATFSGDVRGATITAGGAGNVNGEIKVITTERSGATYTQTINYSGVDCKVKRLFDCPTGGGVGWEINNTRNGQQYGNWLELINYYTDPYWGELVGEPFAWIDFRGNAVLNTIYASDIWVDGEGALAEQRSVRSWLASLDRRVTALGG